MDFIAVGHHEASAIVHAVAVAVTAVAVTVAVALVAVAVVAVVVVVAVTAVAVAAVGSRTNRVLTRPHLWSMNNLHRTLGGSATTTVTRIRHGNMNVVSITRMRGGDNHQRIPVTVIAVMMIAAVRTTVGRGWIVGITIATTGVMR